VFTSNLEVGTYTNRDKQCSKNFWMGKIQIQSNLNLDPNVVDLLKNSVEISRIAKFGPDLILVNSFTKSMDKCLQFNDSVLCPPFISFIRANNFPPPQVQCGDTDPLTCQRDERHCMAP
jgi:hypothetical protein